MIKGHSSSPIDPAFCKGAADLVDPIRLPVVLLVTTLELVGSTPESEEFFDSGLHTSHSSILSKHEPILCD